MSHFRGYLLGDVPDMSSGIESHQSVLDGHLVERRPLLVSKERVGNPDVVDLVLSQSDLVDRLVNRRKGQTWVTPPLA